MRLLVLAVAALLPLIDLVFAQPPAAAGKKYALLVGVNEYDHRQLANLKYAERDVTELAKVLERNGFEVTLLLGSASGAKKATRANIEKAVADVLKKVTKKDTLLTAFAGHGEQFKPPGATEEQPFFCPVDAKPNDAARLYPFNDLLKKLDADGAGTNLVLVDACRSINDANRGTRSGIDGSKAVGLAVGTVVFFACSRDQEARETEKAGGGHGVFFHHVIDGLKGNAANKRGQVTWDGLVAHVKDQTAAAYSEWFPGLPQAKWQQPQSIGNTSGAVVIVSGDMAKKADDGKEFTSKTTGMKFARIPKGTFMMGWSSNAPDKRGQPEVTLTTDYYLGVYEVTRGQFQQFVEAENYKTEGETSKEGGRGWDPVAKKMVRHPKFTWRSPGFEQSDDHPVVMVTWNDAVKFCDWLGKMDGKQHRLPSEAEWQYACEAGSRKTFHFGEDKEELAQYGNVADASYQKFFADENVTWAIKASDGYVFTAPVGKFRPNRFGLHDMYGNVEEWCLDTGVKLEPKPVRDPVRVLAEKDAGRVSAGGGWDSASFELGFGAWSATSSDSPSASRGFRVCFRVK